MGLKKLVRAGLGVFIALSLTACGGKEEKAPELLEPTENRDAIYTVARGDLTTIHYSEGWVSPGYITFAPGYATTVSDIAVKVGDSVSQGQQMMKLNADLQQQIENLQEEISIQEKSFEVLLERQEDQLDALKQQKRMFQNIGDNYNARLVQISIDQMEYEFSFQNADTQLQLEEMKQTLADYEEEVKNTIVTAPCSGTVVYMNATEDGEVAADVPYLILAREDEKYLACAYLEEETLAEYSSVQVRINGELYDVEHIPYTEQELYEREESGTLTESRFWSESLPQTLQYGDYVAFQFTKVKEDVLSVPTDALTLTGDQYYVSIYKDGKLEQRAVEIGEHNLNNTEITEGLSEQESVFVAKNLSSYSATKETVSAQKGEFSLEVKMTGAERHAAWLGTLENKIPGTITELLIQNVSEVYVEEGQGLYVIEANISEVDIAQAQLDLKNGQKEYSDRVEQYEEQIEEQQERLEDMKKGTEKELAEAALANLIKEYEQYVEDGAKHVEELSERAENFAAWQGQEVTVCAEQNCVIESFSSLKVGLELPENEFICNILDPNTFTIRVNDSSGQLHYGQKVIYQSTKNGESISAEATVLFTEGSDSVWDGQTEIVLDDPAMYYEANNTGTIVFDRCQVSDALLLSTTVLRQEIISVDDENGGNSGNAPGSNEDSEGTATVYYVWVLNDDGVTVRRDVAVAETYYENAWIIDGLSEDDLVVTP